MILALAAAVKNTSNATASWRDASLTFVSRIEKGMKKFIPFLWTFLHDQHRAVCRRSGCVCLGHCGGIRVCTDIAGKLVCNGFFAPKCIKNTPPSILKAPMFMLRLSRFL
jgi:hypothetical protein